ncbi:DnaT-like ssDNA-binding protein [Ruegeria jejuensis]|uniref:DnaT-like ssDNA-binding protein n=1 Tax=Ruegeria jejuensis TaxID=3233338 RepID=UPI00355BE4B5
MALDTTIGGASADSYATLAEYRSYAEAMGWCLTLNDITDEINLRRAAIVNDAGHNWLDYRVSADQALQWPRYIARYVDGFPVPADSIPTPVKNAQMEMAYLIQNGADPFATVSTGSVVSERKKVDVIETEATYKDSSALMRPEYTGVDRLLMPYTSGRVGQKAASVPNMRV